MANANARTKGTGARGAKSSRWDTRENAKAGARRARREEDRLEEAEAYAPRFVTEAQLTELINLWHLSRVACCEWVTDPLYQHKRRVWAAREFSKATPGVSESGAYKDLDASLSF